MQGGQEDRDETRATKENKGKRTRKEGMGSEEERKQGTNIGIRKGEERKGRGREDAGNGGRSQAAAHTRRTRIVAAASTAETREGEGRERETGDAKTEAGRQDDRKRRAEA
jgi:hypothetical protein